MQTFKNAFMETFVLLVMYCIYFQSESMNERVNISLLFYVLPHLPVQTNQCSPARYLYLVIERTRGLQFCT